MPIDAAPPAWSDDLVSRIDELIEEYRTTLHDCLDGLTEEEARTRLVPSATTLLGVVQHVTYVEGVWFDQAVTGRSPATIGIPASPARSFVLEPTASIARVQEAYRQRWARSRAAMAALQPGDVVEGRGARPVWALQLQVLRELAHHAGHADILREQVLAQRTDPGGRPGVGGP